MYVGSVAEDAQFSGSSSYVSSKRALHGFAASFAFEAASAGIRSLYYMPGLVDSGMVNVLNKKQIATSMQSIGQEKLVPAGEIAERIAQSLYIAKVPQVHDLYEGILLVRRDGYRI